MINIGLITAKQAKLRPNAWAVYDQTSNKRITFLELDELVKKIANGLIDLGLEKGDRVSILSQNTIEFFLPEVLELFGPLYRSQRSGLALP